MRGRARGWGAGVGLALAASCCLPCACAEEGPAAPPPAVEVKFLGPNNETALEYLTGAKLNFMDRSRWEGDKKTAKYHTFLATVIHSTQEATRKAQAMEIGFYKKLKWEEGGGGELDLGLLESLISKRQDLTDILSHVHKTLKTLSPPKPFLNSHRSFSRMIAHRVRTEGEVLSRFRELVEGWKEKMDAAAEPPPFPVQGMFDILRGEDKSNRLSRSLHDEWEKKLLQDCSRYLEKPCSASPKSSASATATGY